MRNAKIAKYDQDWHKSAIYNLQDLNRQIGRATNEMERYEALVEKYDGLVSPFQDKAVLAQMAEDRRIEREGLIKEYHNVLLRHFNSSVAEPEAYDGVDFDKLDCEARYPHLKEKRVAAEAARLFYAEDITAQFDLFINDQQ